MLLDSLLQSFTAVLCFHQPEVIEQPNFLAPGEAALVSPLADKLREAEAEFQAALDNDPEAFQALALLRQLSENYSLEIQVSGDEDFVKRLKAANAALEKYVAVRKAFADPE